MNKSSFFIAAGWAEGGWHAKKLSKALKSTGLHPTYKIRDMDIIITHSAGGLWIPPKAAPRLVIAINPPYWPGRSSLSSFYQNVIADFPKQVRAWGLKNVLLKLVWNVFYIIIAPVRSAITPRILKRSDFINSVGNARFVIVRNKDDAFCSPDIKEVAGNNIKYYELPGLHEDVWFNPKPYVDLILKEL
jgi:hypothetical protein